jgi:hypothetical protein
VSNVLQTIRRASWRERLLAVVLGCNSLLILWGVHVVPAVIYPSGIATTLADVGMQLAIGLLVFFGPLAFQRYSRSIGIALLLGAFFAAAYSAVLLSDFLPSVNWDFNVLLLFLGSASLAGFLAGYQTRRIGQGVIIGFWSLVIGTAIWSIGTMMINYAFWGSHDWYFFWKNDGAIDDFLHSGSTNLRLFILQDMQGALFFHPLLSAFIGALCGLCHPPPSQGVLLIQRTFFNHAVASVPGHEDSL